MALLATNAINVQRSGGTDVSDTTATAADVLAGKDFHLADGSKAAGIIQSQPAQTIYPSTQDQTIVAGKYLAGAQTIKAVKVSSNLVAANIAQGVTVTVGDADDPDRILSVTGTHQGGGGNAFAPIVALGAFYGDTAGSTGLTTLSCTLSCPAGKKAFLIVMHRANITVSTGTRIVYVQNPGFDQRISIYEIITTSSNQVVTITNSNSSVRLCACSVYATPNVVLETTPTVLSRYTGRNYNEFRIPAQQSLVLVVASWVSVANTLTEYYAPTTGALPTLPANVASGSKTIRLFAATFDCVATGNLVSWNTVNPGSDADIYNKTYLFRLYVNANA